MRLPRIIIRFLRLLRYGSPIACRLTKLTGKSAEAVHPKHLINSEHHWWYLKYLDRSFKVLDVGCGIGVHAIKCAEVCKEVIGFDLNEKNLEIAHKMAQRKGLKNIRFMQHNAEERFPFENESFDAVLHLDVIEHLIQRDFVLMEINRVLKKNGLLMLSAPNRDTTWKRMQREVGLPYYSDPDHKIEYTLDELEMELKKSEFEIVGIEPVVYDTPFAGLIDLIGGISLALYRKLQATKVESAKRNPHESIGFRVIAKKISSGV